MIAARKKSANTTRTLPRAAPGKPACVAHGWPVVPIALLDGQQQGVEE
jgi:hypothetical protein